MLKLLTVNISHDIIGDAKFLWTKFLEQMFNCTYMYDIETTQIRNKDTYSICENPINLRSDSIRSQMTKTRFSSLPIKITFNAGNKNIHVDFIMECNYKKMNAIFCSL